MQSLRPRTQAGAVALCLAAALAGCGSEPMETTTFPVTRSERTWVDSSRAARGEARTLRTLIWRPSAEGPRPLILLAHGFGGLPEKFDAFATTLASLGNLVVAPAFPLTNQNTPGGHEQNLGDFRNQPEDVRFVLDRLEQARSTATDSLAAAFDPKDITLIGHSLGGVTALGLLRHDCCLDARFKAAVLVSTPGFLETGFGGEILPVAIPVLVVHGTDDPTVAYESAPDLFASFGAPKMFVGVRGALHSDLIESQEVPPIPSREATQDAILGFLRGIRTGDHSWGAAQAHLESAGHLVRVELPR